MQFNPITMELYTDKDDFTKSLQCPLKINWELLAPHNLYSKKCDLKKTLPLDASIFASNQL